MSASSEAEVVDTYTRVSSEDSASDPPTSPPRCQSSSKITSRNTDLSSQDGRSHLDIFRCHYSDLVLAISSCLNTVANKLYSRNIISDEILSRVLKDRETRQNIASNLLLCVKRNIDSNPAVLLEFVGVLKEEPSCDGITKKITSESMPRYIIMLDYIKIQAGEAIIIALNPALCVGSGGKWPWYPLFAHVQVFQRSHWAYFHHNNKGKLYIQSAVLL